MSPILAVSDVVWQAVIGGAVTIILALLALITQRLVAIAKTGEKTHTLVNSQMGGVLTLVDELSRWKAVREPTPENIKAAELAARMLKEHDSKQAVVDSKS